MAHTAAIAAGIPDELFWRLTPYNLNLRLKAIGRQRMEAALFTGWFTQRFACEQKLSGPQHYVREFLDGINEVDGAAQAEAELTRMALQWGLELVDLEEQPE